MKDELGQERTAVRGRELTIAALFVVLVGVGVWTVALPALNEDPEKPDGVSESAPPDTDAPTQAPTQAK